MPIEIPSGGSLTYSSAAHSNETFYGLGAMQVAAASVLNASFKAGALQGLTGDTPPPATISGTYAATAGLRVGSGSNSAYATVRDLPKRLTLYINAYLAYTDTHVTLATDAPGGTYTTDINIIRWNTAKGYTAKLFANHSNSASPLVLTGGMSQVYSGFAVSLSLGGTNTLANTLSGNIVDGTGPIGLVKEGVGTWIFSGDNSFTGGITVTGGTLGVRHSNGLGAAASGAVTVNDGCTLRIGGNVAVTKTAGISVRGAGVGGVGAIHCTDGVNSFAGAVSLAANTTVQVDAGATLTFTGGLNYNGFTLTKIGSGTLIAPAATTATGAVSITDGLVRVTYGERKALPGAVTLGATAQLAAQDDGSHYRATVAGALTMAAGAKLTFGPPV